MNRNNHTKFIVGLANHFRILKWLAK